MNFKDKLTLFMKAYLMFISIDYIKESHVNGWRKVVALMFIPFFYTLIFFVLCLGVISIWLNVEIELYNIFEAVGYLTGMKVDGCRKEVVKGRREL